MPLLHEASISHRGEVAAALIAGDRSARLNSLEPTHMLGDRMLRFERISIGIAPRPSIKW